MMRECDICKVDISHRSANALTCSKSCSYKRTYKLRRQDPERVQKERDYMRVYMRKYLSDEGNRKRHHAAVKKYQSTEKGRAAVKRSREAARRKKNAELNRQDE